MTTPSKPRRRTDPATRKARDKARQRKIVANSSDKAARRNAPRIKAAANRALRRTTDAALRHDPAAVEAGAIRAALVQRDRHWGSDNAARLRAIRDEEKTWLQANPPRGRPGRHRWQVEAIRRDKGWALDDSRFLAFLRKWGLPHPATEEACQGR